MRTIVRIHEYPHGRLAVFHGPHRLAEYESRHLEGTDAEMAAQQVVSRRQTIGEKLRLFYW